MSEIKKKTLLQTLLADAVSDLHVDNGINTNGTPISITISNSTVNILCRKEHQAPGEEA